jgi:hypothetical protein
MGFRLDLVRRDDGFSGSARNPLLPGPVEAFVGPKPILVHHASALPHPIAQIVEGVALLPAPLEFPEGRERTRGPFAVVWIPEEVAGRGRRLTEVEDTDAAKIPGRALASRLTWTVGPLTLVGDAVLDEPGVDVTLEEKLDVFVGGEDPRLRGNHEGVPVEKLNMFVSKLSIHDPHFVSVSELSQKPTLTLTWRKGLDGNPQRDTLSTVAANRLVEQFAVST